MIRTALAAAAVAIAAALPGAQPVRTPPASTPPVFTGENTPPARLTLGPPVTVTDDRVAVAGAAPPAALTHGTVIAVANGLAFVRDPGEGYSPHTVLHAIDLRDGTERWSVHDVFPETFTSGTRLVYVATNDDQTLALDGATGAVVRRIDGSVAGVVDDIAYGAGFGGDGGFVAYDARTAQPVWRNRTFARLGTGGKPALLGALLLQAFVESGAITVDRMHAFDVRTGRELWSHGYGPDPLGTADGRVYLNTTWFPMQLDGYVPQTIGTVDTRTGALLREVTYRPDPDRNARGDDRAHAAQAARVAGGYAYVEVKDAWYRYDADRDASDAHPVRLDGLAVHGILPDGALVGTAHDRLVVARPTADGVTLAEIGPAPPTPSPQPPSPLPYGVTRTGPPPPDPAYALRASDGRAFAIAGGVLFAIDAGEQRVRRLGSVPCGSVRATFAWAGGVTVLCDARLLTFTDPAAARPVAIARPEPPPPPRFALALDVHAIPPASGFSKQWWPSAIAPAPDGGLALALSRGAQNLTGAVARVSSAGRIALTTIGVDDETPSHASAIAEDERGTLWFNDDRDAIVSSLDRGGRLTSTLIGLPSSPLPAPLPTMPNGRPFPRRLTTGIRLARAADGTVWFARSHPTAQMGRLPDGPRFPLPPSVDTAFVMRAAASDGFWFFSRTGFVRVAHDGRVLGEATFPRGLRTFGEIFPVAIAPDDTAWAADGNRVLHLSRDRVLAIVPLPDAASAVSGLTVGCDGTLYAADAAGPQIARIDRSGSIDELPAHLTTIDALVTGSDCRLWFAAGGNAPDQQVGTFRFAPR